MTTSPDQKTKLAQDLEKLDSQVAWVIRGVLVTIGCVLLIYFVWFALMLRQGPSESTAAWGTFGDYFGGLLNPIIAFTALYWLTRSVRLQKEELNETRAALEDSATAQRNQVEVSSWTALINANTAQVQHLHYQLGQVKQRIADAQPREGQVFMGDQYRNHLMAIDAIQAEAKPLEAELADRAKLGSEYEAKLRTLVQKLAGGDA